MEFVAARLQTCIYTENMPFGMERDSSGDFFKSVYFATSIPMNRKAVKNGEKVIDDDGKWLDLDKFDLRFIKFELETDGVLTMRIFSDRQNGESAYANFSLLLPPYRSRRGKSYSNACNQIKSHLDSGTNEDVLEIMENVIAFKLRPHNYSGRNLQYDQNVSTTPPYLMEIEISVIDSKDNFRKWQDAQANEKKEIETESGYTFRRAVLLGDWRNER